MAAGDGQPPRQFQGHLAIISNPALDTECRNNETDLHPITAPALRRILSCKGARHLSHPEVCKVELACFVANRKIAE